MADDVQGSEAWLAWRRSGLGSSDAPIVMGVSPWTTRYQLWEQKLGIDKPDPNANTWVTDRGHRLEPRARAAYEIENGFVDMPPTCVEHAAYPWLRASLDGYNADLSRVLEIKAPGKESHALAKQGFVPHYYQAQVQEQLLVTGAERCDYFSFFVENEGTPNERVDTATVIVRPDIVYCRTLLDTMRAFWDLVLTATPPELTDKDFKYVRAKGFKARCAAYVEARAGADRMLAELCADPAARKYGRWRCGNLQVGTLTVPGRIAYDKVPQLDGVNLALYRSPSVDTTHVNVTAEGTDDEP